MDEHELAFLPVAGQAERIRRGDLSSRELTQAVLTRIGRLDPTLNAFAQVLGEQALAEAAHRDGVSASADRGPLHGVPIAVKDEVDVAGMLTGFGGSACTRPASVDAEYVRRLRAAEAVIVGKTRMPEFGQFPFTESAAHGYTRNPWDPSRTPGGSSGGSAVAVASGMVAGATGGDGGGSIRIPAAYCGLFGLKPQRGRVSAAPSRDLWRALGTAGPLTRTVLDSALMYDAMRGTVAVDRWTAAEPRMSFVQAATSAPHKLRIAVSDRPAQRGARVERECLTALGKVADALAELGHDVIEHDPSYPELAPAFVPQMLGGYARKLIWSTGLSCWNAGRSRCWRSDGCSCCCRAMGGTARRADRVPGQQDLRFLRPAAHPDCCAVTAAGWPTRRCECPSGGVAGDASYCVSPQSGTSAATLRRLCLRECLVLGRRSASNSSADRTTKLRSCRSQPNLSGTVRGSDSDRPSINERGNHPRRSKRRWWPRSW